MKHFLYLVFFISISVASFKVFNLDDSILNYLHSFKKEPVITEISTPEKNVIPTEINYSFAEHIERGDSYFQQNFIELARDEYLLAVKKDPQASIGYIKLSDAQSLLKNYQGSIKNLYTAAQIENSLEIQKKIIQNEIHLFQFDQAKAKLLTLQEQDPELDYLLDAIILVSMAEIPANTEIIHADTFTKSYNIQKAFTDFSIFQGGQNIYLQALIAQALIKNQDYELALFLLKKIIAERSDYRDVWIMMGYNYLQLEDFAQAKFALSKAYDLDTTKAETQFFLALALENLGEKESAFEYYQLAYKNKYEPAVHVIQKVVELSLEFEYYQEAFTLYQELLKLNHESVDSFIKPVWIAIDKISDLEKAEKMAEWAKNLFPTQPQSYNLMAWVSIAKKDYPRAQSFLNQAFQFDPNFPAAHYNQGLLYTALNDKESALKSYETAYQNDKDGPIGNIAAQAYNELLNK